MESEETRNKRVLIAHLEFALLEQVHEDRDNLLPSLHCSHRACLAC